MNICTKCKVEKPEDESHWRSQAKGTRKSACKVCTAKSDALAYKESRRKGSRPDQSSAIRTRNNLYILNLLQQSECADCGESDIRVLEFDHLADKTKGVSELRTHSLKRIQEEIDKCEVVCANCHRKRTYARSGAMRHTMAISMGMVLDG